MSEFLDALASGTFGVIAALPSGWKLQEERATSAAFVASDRPMGAWLFFFPGLHLDLDPAHDAAHRADIERHTRTLFETMFAQSPAPGAKPRTSDPAWSPVIEVQRDRDSLYVLHRMSYQPGGERIMGHTLVPTKRGLFEARWYAMSRQTGMREAIVTDLLLARGGNPMTQTQATFDDPALDAQFPMHPLSLTRAMKRWRVDGKLEITEPAAAPVREVTVAGRTFALPPRFVAHASAPQATRVSFAGTDGVDVLTFHRTNERLRWFGVNDKLARLAEAHARAQLDKHANVVVSVQPEDRAVTVTAAGDSPVPANARLRAASRWFLDDDGYAWWVELVSSIAVPVKELVATVEQLAR